MPHRQGTSAAGEPATAGGWVVSPRTRNAGSEELRDPNGRTNHANLGSRSGPGAGRRASSRYAVGWRVRGIHSESGRMAIFFVELGFLIAVLGFASIRWPPRFMRLGRRAGAVALASSFALVAVGLEWPVHGV